MANGNGGGAPKEPLSQESQVAKARANASTMTSLTVLMVVIILCLNSVFTFSVWRHEQDVKDTTDQKIDELTADLEAARVLLASVTSETAELSRCSGTFATLLSESSYDHEAAGSELLVAILRTIQIPIENRDPSEVERLVSEVETSRNAYRMAVAQRKAWTEAGSPLPCPL